MKICEDCVHFHPDTIAWSSEGFQRKYAICDRTSIVSRNSGKSCETERTKWFYGCGKDAKYFAPKEAK